MGRIRGNYKDIFINKEGQEFGTVAVEMTEKEIAEERSRGNVEERTETYYLPLSTNPSVAVPVNNTIECLRDGKYLKEIIKKFEPT